MSAIMSEPSRTERFAAQLIEKLATLPDDDARRAFLRRQAANWERKYDHFIAAVDSGRIELTPDGPTAFDYVATISEIQIRLGQYERNAA